MRFFDRVFSRIERQLVGGGIEQVDVQQIGQPGQVDQHIGDLLAHRLVLLGVQVLALLRG